MSRFDDTASDYLKRMDMEAYRAAVERESVIYQKKMEIELQRQRMMIDAQMLAKWPSFAVEPPKFDPEWRRQYEIAREAAAFDRMVTYT